MAKTARAALFAAPVLCMAGVLTGTNVWLSGCIFDTREEKRILFLGNSITHSNPLPSFGWSGSWGMAASRADSDYVHLTLSGLTQAGLTVRQLEVGTLVQDWYGDLKADLSALPQLADDRAEWVVLQYGEHFSREEAQSGLLEELYGRYVRQVSTHLDPEAVFCLSVWPDTSVAEPRTAAVRRACESFPHAYFVDATSAARTPGSSGDSTLYWDRDVRWHPGDVAMRIMAQVLVDRILAKTSAKLQ